MKIYKITEASEYLGVSINTLKTLAKPRRYDNENRRTKRTQSRAGVSG
jgi:hypothetical protein